MREPMNKSEADEQSMMHKPKLIVGFKGKTEQDESVQQIKTDIDAGRAQGVILFGYNIEGPDQLRDLIAYLKKGAEDLLVCIDQEGGAVQRLRKRNGFTDYPKPFEVAQKPLQEAEEIYSQMAKELADLGINYNFGPCVDVHNERSEIIAKYGRSYGDEASVRKIEDYAGAFVRAHRKYGVRTCLKHFPGHGSAKGDTHKGFVDATAYWSSDEMDIFDRVLKATQADGVMSAHIHHDAWPSCDESGIATFSHHLLTDVLQERYGFKGDIIADDFCMGAIVKHFKPEEAVHKALAAGVNMFIYSINRAASGGESLAPFENIAENFWQYVENFSKLTSKDD